MNDVDQSLDSAATVNLEQIRQRSIEATPARQLACTKENSRARLRAAADLGAKMGVFGGVAAGTILILFFCLGGGLSGQQAGTRFLTLAVLFLCSFGAATALGYLIGLLVALLRPVEEHYRYLPERPVPLLLFAVLLLLTGIAGYGVFHESAHWKLMANAQQYVREGKFLEARAVLDQAVSQPAPLGIADAYNLRGWIHAQRADFAAAIADYNQALKEDPKHVLALKNRAWAHDCLGQDEDAMRDYAAIMQLEPASAWAYKYRGELLARNGDTAKALADLDEVMRLEPDNPWPHWRTAELLQLTSQTEAALQAAGAAVELGQDDAAAYLARGRARQALGQFSAARADLTRARQLDPRHADIARELDLCRAWEQVARCTETLDSSSSPAAADLRARGQAYLTLGELDRARADFEAAREREPKNADAWIYLGNLNMKRKELEQARADYQRAIELAPENALARNNRGKALLEAGDVQGAIQDFERALALEAQLPEAHYNLGKLSYTTGANGQAVRQLSLALESRPGWVAALDLRGRAHLAEKRHDLALADFEACLNLQPERTAHWQHLLGLIQERKGNTGAAVQHHRQAVEIAPRKADYYHALGRAYLADGQYERGLTDLLRARWLGCKGADFLNDLAWAHHLNRDYAQAISIYDLALQLKPDDAWILYRRALASMRLGRHQDALANLDRAVQLRPDYAAAAQIRRVLSEEN